MTGATPPELAEFCRVTQPRLVRTVGLYLGDGAVAEDLVQEALVRTALRWQRLHDPAAFAYRCAMSLARSHVRRRQAERRALRRFAGQVPGYHQDPDTAMRLAVRASLQRLPESQRAVLALRHGAQLPVEETAAVLGLTADAVRSRAKRGLAQLRVDLASPSDTPTAGRSPR